MGWVARAAVARVEGTGAATEEEGGEGEGEGEQEQSLVVSVVLDNEES